MNHLSKSAIGIVLGVAIVLSCSSRKIEDAGWDVTIHGKVGFPQPGTISVREFTPDNSAPSDSIKLTAANTFSKKIHLTQQGFYQINFYNLQVVNFILNKSDLEINVDGNAMQGFAEVKGSPEHDLIAKVHEAVSSQRSLPTLASLEKEYTDAVAKNDQPRIVDLRKQYAAIMKQENDKIAQLLLQQPASLAVMNLLQSNVLDRDIYANVYDDACQKLKKELPNSALAREFVSQVETARAVSIGRLAPDIALPNPNGDTVRLSSLRGKYVLVDFWAKWCGPCRRENPNVVAAYHRFKGKGFEVYGVSLDRNKADWVQAIEQDGLVWTQVSDLSYFNSKAAKLYNVNAIPFSILVDPKGIIIAKNLRGTALEQKLEEVLGK